MMNWLKHLLPLILVDFLKTHITIIENLLKKADYDRKISNSKKKAFYCFPL